MTVWAIADLHLSFGVPGKKMDVFGPKWENHAQRIEENWTQVINNEDLVLIAGDISWAMTLEEALPDLAWIDRLPGQKVMIKGNHDFWWGSVGKVRKSLPPSCHILQNDAFLWRDIAIGGARLWDTAEYGFSPYIDFVKREEKEKKEEPVEENEKIFERELQRLEMSLKALDTHAKTRIVMTHYPPISADLQPSKVSHLLEKYRVDVCVFGHLHNLKEGLPLFGEKNGVRYELTACDYLKFKPLKIL